MQHNYLFTILVTERSVAKNAPSLVERCRHNNYHHVEYIQHWTITCDHWSIFLQSNIAQPSLQSLQDWTQIQPSDTEQLQSLSVPAEMAQVRSWPIKS